jgi:hypothetical protein
MFDYFTEIIRHALELSIQSLSQGVDAFPFRIWGLCSNERLLEGTKNFLKFRLLARDKV